MAKRTFERLQHTLSRVHDLTGRCADVTRRAGVGTALREQLLGADFHLEEARLTARDGQLATDGTHYGVLLTLRHATVLSRPERRRLAHLRGEGRMTEERAELEGRELIGAELPGLRAGQRLLLPVTGLEELIGAALNPVTAPLPVSSAHALRGWVRAEEDGHAVFLEVHPDGLRVNDQRPGQAPRSETAGRTHRPSRTHLMLAATLLSVGAAVH